VNTGLRVVKLHSCKKQFLIGVLTNAGRQVMWPKIVVLIFFKFVLIPLQLLCVYFTVYDLYFIIILKTQTLHSQHFLLIFSLDVSL